MKKTSIGNIVAQIKNGNGDVILVIRNFLSMNILQQLNTIGTLDMTFPITEHGILKTEVKQGYRIDVYYIIDSATTPCIFSGYVRGYTLGMNIVNLFAYDWIAYTQNRLLRESKRYQGIPVKEIVKNGIDTVNTIYPLPFTLRENNVNTIVSQITPQGATLYEFLGLVEQVFPNLIYRILNENNQIFLDIGESIGKLLDGVRNYNIDNPQSANIQDRKRKATLEEFWNAMMSTTNTEKEIIVDDKNLKDIGLMFERYEYSKTLNPRTNTKGVTIPSIVLDGSDDRWNINIGDKKNIRINTGAERAQIGYIGLIQGKEIRISGVNISANIKISEKFVKASNFLDLLVSNLRKDLNTLIKQE